ncbi:MAG: ABC transporter ATP-binding protein [Variovorax sp.]
MNHFLKRGLAAAALGGMLVGLAAPPAKAQTTAAPARSGDDASRELVLAPYAHHFSHDSEHRHVVLVGLERIQRDGSLWGGAIFRNSFGQGSGYAYYGQVWDDIFDGSGVYFKLSGGILYGYRGNYKDKVPFNHGGFSPAIIPAVGYRMASHDALQVAALGKAGLIFSYNHGF